jgi:hypothetical protein
METDRSPLSWWSARGRCRIDAHEFVVRGHITRAGAVVVLRWQHVEELLENMKRNLHRALVGAAPLVATSEAEALGATKGVERFQLLILAWCVRILRVIHARWCFCFVSRSTSPVAKLRGRPVMLMTNVVELGFLQESQHTRSIDVFWQT